MVQRVKRQYMNISGAKQNECPWPTQWTDNINEKTEWLSISNRTFRWYLYRQCHPRRTDNIINNILRVKPEEIAEEVFAKLGLLFLQHWLQCDPTLGEVQTWLFECELQHLKCLHQYQVDAVPFFCICLCAWREYMLGRDCGCLNWDEIKENFKKCW